MLFQAPAADSIAAVVRDVMASPEYAWHERRDPWRVLMAGFRRLMTWLAELQYSHPVAFYAVLGLMTLLLIAILVHMAWVLREALRGRGPVTARAEPVVARRDADWYHRRARELAQDGQFAAALAARFTALVLELQQAGAVRYHPSKTPAEYAAEARLAPESRESFRALVDALYLHEFGAVPCLAGDYRSFDDRAAALRRPRAAQ